MADKFPKGLLDWAGQRAGGVRRLFHQGSGRPAGTIIETPLLKRVRSWAEGLAARPKVTPRVLLLVGGPGNGKTEAVEAAVAALDQALQCGGSLVGGLSKEFNRQDGKAVPRLATLQLLGQRQAGAIEALHLVQDASSGDSGAEGETLARLLLEDLEKFGLQEGASGYLACINRGVLDDALIEAREAKRECLVKLLECTIRAASLSSEPVPCWPLSDFPWVAVWPMDVESLVIEREGAGPSAAAQLLQTALAPDSWRDPATCGAGDLCPHCSSKEALTAPDARKALLSLLHYYELASGQRWTFRDLNSLVSYLLAGAHPEAEGNGDPCAWAASQVAAMGATGHKARHRRQLAPFLLVAAQYQHALFAAWDAGSPRGHRDDLRAVTKSDESLGWLVDAFEGLFSFMAGGRASRVPSTVAGHLKELCASLDPAMASPEKVFYESGENTKRFQQLDVRFSQSVGAGLAFVRPHKWLTPAEVALLVRLAKADEELSRSAVRRRAPIAASRLQQLLRGFSCRLVRRSIGTRKALVRDAGILAEYSGVASGDASRLHAAAKQVESLLNNRDRFELCLNTTFGEPLPPAERRATLRTSKQRVRPSPTRALDRPEALTKFISIGSGSATYSVPMTFELFRAVTELSRGLLPASLPRPVVALLDSVRARLAGMVVRDADALDDADIVLGKATEVVAYSQDEFVVRMAGDL